tara:strand:- start:56 stop:226 length:171 start_codon:yes stop_codon:yes gene_type:complete
MKNKMSNSTVNLLIKKYEEELRNKNIMDDFDGGEANQLRKVIDDLRDLMWLTAVEK